MKYLKDDLRSVYVAARLNLLAEDTLPKILRCRAIEISMGLTHHRQVVSIATANCGMVPVTSVVPLSYPVGVKFRWCRVAHFYGV